MAAESDPAHLFPDFSDVLRQIDDLLSEGANLRERITVALDNERRALLPERRSTHHEHEPERRKRG